MTNRLVLDQDGLRISPPGVDVLAQSSGEYNFTAGMSGVKPYVTGSFNLAHTVSVNIYYGKTFSFKPLVMFRIGDYNFINDFMIIYEGFGYYYNSFWALIYNDHFFMKFVADAGLVPNPCPVNYYVWEVNQ